MQRRFLTAVAAFGLSLSATAQDGAWLTDFDAAKAAAAKHQRPILVDFTGSDWCGWCIKLKDEVFDTAEFRAWAKEHVVLLELDFPRKKEQPEELAAQNRALQRRYGVRGFPTILFLDADGDELGRSGYRRGGAARWIADAEEKLAAAGRGAPVWLTGFEVARKQAEQQGKLILADFTGSDWCGWCIKLKDEVFDTAEFRAWAKEHVVLLELDFPRRKEQPKELAEQNRALQRRYGVRGFPTILFLDADGAEVGRSGYRRGGPKAWIAAVEKQLGEALERGRDGKRGR